MEMSGKYRIRVGSEFYLLLLVIGLQMVISSPLGGRGEPGFRKDWPGEIRIGLIATYGIKESEVKFQDLLKHLEQKLGLKIQARFSNDFNWFLISFAKKELDFALMGPSNYVDAHNLFGVEVLAMELLEDGKPGYHSVIITSAKSGIKTIDDARGKVLAFTDQNSTSGFIVPTIYFLKEKRQTPAQFAARVVFAGSPQNLVEGILAQNYDFGATNEVVLERLCESLKLKPSQFRVLWKSELIPSAPFVARKDLPEGLKKAFLEALLSFNQNRTALKKMRSEGFVPAQDSDFDAIRRWHKYLPR
jgi:phosphonate transport system substrate-binding protein